MIVQIMTIKNKSRAINTAFFINQKTNWGNQSQLY